MSEKENSNRKWNLFPLLDIFGVNYQFLIEGKESSQTYTGAWITIFYGLIVIGLFFGFGIDLYQRKNPRVSLNSETQPYSLYTMANKNFTYAFRIEDKNGATFLDESIVTTKIYYQYYILKNGTWELQILETLQRKRCHDLPNYKEKEALYNISLNSWYCINFDNITWGGNWDGNFVAFFQVNAEQCINSTSNNFSCSSQQTISNAFINEITSGNLFYSDLSMYVQPALNNYTEPLGSVLINNYQMLNMQITKRKVQTYKIHLN